jgi:TrmH family RNA methyltransferase
MALPTLIRDLHRRKARERRGLALAEGVRLVEELLSAGVECSGAAVSPALESTPRGAALIATLDAKGIGIERVGDQELAAMAATEHPQGVVVVYRPVQWELGRMAPAISRPLVVLDGVQDPGNVGTIARTALAFGAAGLLTLPGTVDLTNPKVVRSAAGALFRLPNLAVDTVAFLSWRRAVGAELWAATMDGSPVAATESSRVVALVLGNEGAGISADLLAETDRRVGIAIRPEAESLNVAVAAGILLHQLGQP